MASKCASSCFGAVVLAALATCGWMLEYAQGVKGRLPAKWAADEDVVLAAV